MKRILLILVLGCTMSAMALVPPRDPSRWADWQAAAMLQSQVDTQHHGVARMPQAVQTVGTRTIIPRVLVIMANFADYELISTKADVDSMFNGLNWTKDGATGSIRQYFYDQSDGAYNPQFDIVGPITLSQGYAYYGEGANGSRRAGYMVTEACALMDDEVDFSIYDSDEDGYIDLVYIFFAGYGENDPPTFISRSENLIWPAYWTVDRAGCGQNSRVFDGKTLNAFEYSNELDGYYSTVDKQYVAGIGIACHEFCHALGLPDLYYTGSGNATHKLLGKWDIMGYGPYNNDMHTPPSFSAYERFFMCWLMPTLITEADNWELEHIATSNKALLIAEGDKHNLDGVTPNPNIFYLLENRQRKGWDIDVPGDGMLITRINYQSSWWRGNIVNNNANDLGVDLIEADGLTPSINTDDGAYGKKGDAFPNGATEYLGITDHAITNITMTDGIVRFAYRGGKQDGPTNIDAPSVQTGAYTTIRDGQLLIHSNGHIYSAYGMKIE